MTTPQICANCGANQRPGAKFCNSCGKALPPAPLAAVQPPQQQVPPPASSAGQAPLPPPPAPVPPPAAARPAPSPAPADAAKASIFTRPLFWVAVAGVLAVCICASSVLLGRLYTTGELDFLDRSGKATQNDPAATQSEPTAAKSKPTQTQATQGEADATPTLKHTTATTLPTTEIPPTVAPAADGVVMVSAEALAVVDAWGDSIRAFTSSKDPLSNLKGLTAKDVGFWNNSKLGFDLYRDVSSLLSADSGAPWEEGLYGCPHIEEAFTTCNLRIYFTDDTISTVPGGIRVKFEASP